MTFQAPKLLIDILSMKRMGRSGTEETFITRFIMPLGDVKRDAHGNLWKWVSNADGTRPIILWSVHTDTVHHKEGHQDLVMDGKGFLSLAHKKGGTCLGADDGAGLYLAINMIKKKVPGLYIFHRDEESGGRGSAYIAKNYKDLLEKFKFAIALDRRGYDSVITRQFGGTCASYTFAQQMAGILGGKFKPDPTGSFTDTANYTDLIPECTNLSVGYFDQHGPKEKLDVGFLVQLKHKLIATDWSVLKATRDPKAKVYEYAGGHSYGKGYVRPFYNKYPQLGTFAHWVGQNPTFIRDVLVAQGWSWPALKELHEACESQELSFQEMLDWEELNLALAEDAATEEHEPPQEEHEPSMDDSAAYMEWLEAYSRRETDVAPPKVQPEFKLPHHPKELPVHNVEAKPVLFLPRRPKDEEGSGPH